MMLGNGADQVHNCWKYGTKQRETRVEAKRAPKNRQVVLKNKLGQNSEKVKNMDNELPKYKYNTSWCQGPL